MLFPRADLFPGGCRSSRNRSYGVDREVPALAKIDHSIIETALVQEFQRYALVAGQDRLAAAKDDRRHEQMILPARIAWAAGVGPLTATS